MTSFKRFDWALLGSVVFLGAMSSITLLSSSEIYFRRHITFYLLAIATILIGSQIDWRWFFRQDWFRYGIYWVSLALLAFATFGPASVRGTKSWIVIGTFQFEPSELVKLSLIVLFVGFFSRRHIETWRVRNIFLSFFATVLPAALSMLQPDFGSTIIFFGIWMSFLLVGVINIKRLLSIILAGLFIFSVFWFTALQPYQKDRIISFLLPTHDPLGANYNVIQSKIAVGSAGFWGKGFGGGTQVKLNFLPAAKTDFLFAAFVEEWGIVGGFILISTFLFFIYRLVLIGRFAHDNYSRFIVLGTISLIFLHFCINIGSNLGLLPVTGLTLPLFSYGGSSLLTTALLLSIIENIKLEAR